MSSIRAAALIPVLLLAAACGESPLSPTPSLAGTWSGRFEQISCTTTAIDPRTCGHNRIGDVTLVLAGNEDTIAGNVAFRSDQTGALVVSTYEKSPLPVIGSFAPPELALSGSQVASQPNGGTYIGTLSDWRTTLTADVLEGAATWTQTTASKFGATTSVRVYRLTVRKGTRPRS